MSTTWEQVKREADGLSPDQYAAVLPHRLKFLTAHGVDTVRGYVAALDELVPFAPHSARNHLWWG